MTDYSINDFQKQVGMWARETFGLGVVRDIQERTYRFLEEALELAQAMGCSREDAGKLLDYVFSRPVGKPRQEVGGVIVTLGVLCYASDLNLSACASDEHDRIWRNQDAIRAKQLTKPVRSPLPGATIAPGPADSLLRSQPDEASSLSTGGATPGASAGPLPPPNCRACRYSFMEPDDDLCCGHPDAGSVGQYVGNGHGADSPEGHCGPDRPKFQQHPLRLPNGNLKP